MAIIQIPNLPAATSLSGAEQLEIVQAGVSRRTTTKAIADLQAIPCGSFYDTTTQSHGAAGNVVIVSCNQSIYQQGVTLVSSTQFTAPVAGVYNLQFSLQLVASTNNKHAYVWLKKNGSDVAWSNTEVDLANKDYGYVAAWNFMVPLNAGDYLQLAWTSDDAVVLRAANPAPYGPAVPSVIVTMSLIRNA